MPLDDIFHEKDTTFSDAKRLKHFWQWCTVVISAITTVIAIYYSLEEDSSFTPAIFLVCLPALVIAYPLAKLFLYINPNSYHGFTEEDKVDIYHYIITSVLLLAYLLFLFDQELNDSIVFDWLFGCF